jgi:glucokinase
LITLETNKKLKYAIAIDLGGTSIKSAIVDSNAKIYAHYQIESFAQVSPDKVIEQIGKCINELKADFKGEIAGIGIGSPGIVHKGIVKYPPNFKNWKEVNLKKVISGQFKTDVQVDNDAKCAGAAELLFGHGKKYKNFLFLTLGTGIGGAIIIDGKIYRGEQSGAGEFGMMTINFDGPECLGGNPGAVEAYIGRNYFRENEKKELKKLGKDIDFKDLTKLADKNNKTAKALLKKYGFYLGVGITNYFNLMDVRTAVVGGGISNAYKYFIGECNRTIEERSLKTIRKNFMVLRSSINNNAGALGAAALILG